MEKGRGGGGGGGGVGGGGGMAPIPPPVLTPIHMHTMCSIIIVIYTSPHTPLVVGSALKLYMVCIHAKCPGNYRIIPEIVDLPRVPERIAHDICVARKCPLRGIILYTRNSAMYICVIICM